MWLTHLRFSAKIKQIQAGEFFMTVRSLSNGFFMFFDGFYFNLSFSHT